MEKQHTHDQSLIAAAMDGVWLVASDGDLLDVNDVYCHMIGYSRDELLALSIFDLATDNAANQLNAHLQHVIDNGSGRFSTRQRCQNGQVIEVEVSLTYQHETGRLLGFLRDVTAQMSQAQKDLYRVLVENSPDIIMRFDRAGRHLFANQAVKAITNLHAADLIGYPHRESGFPAELCNFLEQHIQTVYITQQCVETIFEYDGPQGPIFLDWRLVPEFDQAGQVNSVLSIARDITKRKLVDLALEKRIEALTMPLEEADIVFEDLFDLADIQRLQDEFSSATGVASIITRPDGTPITTPSNFCRLCSGIIRKTEKGRANCYHSDAVLGRFNSTGPIIQPCISGGLWDAGSAISVKGKHIASWLIGQVRDKTQTEDKIRQYARDIGADEDAAAQAFYEVPAMSREQFGRVAKVLFTLANQLSNIAYQNVQQARFITERKRAEQERLELAMERERMQILANFITQASHEFRTPLSIINTNTYLLGKLSNLAPRTQPLERIEAQVEQITTLLDSLTLMAKLDSGTSDFALTQTNLNDILRAIDVRMKPIYQARQIKGTLETTPEPLWFKCHVHYLKQAVQHLVDNAVTHTPPGGTITLRITHHTGNAIIDVVDTGTGISDDVLPHIFKRFYRADTAGTTRGFGLGLPIAKAIVELHHGRIIVSNNKAPGRGTTASLWLPI